jgi:hypothetical protein
MNISQVMRARCEQAIQALPLPCPFTLPRFVRQVGDQRGRQIELVPSILGASAPCGMLVSTDEIDYICYAANTSPLHARHIVLHELGHWCLEHDGTSVADLDPDPGDPAAITLRPDLGAVPAATTPDVLDDWRARLLPDLPQAAISRILGRTIFAAHDEREAELFALLAGPSIARVAAIPAQRGEDDRAVPLRVRMVFDAPDTPVSHG